MTRLHCATHPAHLLTTDGFCLAVSPPHKPVETLSGYPDFATWAKANAEDPNDIEEAPVNDTTTATLSTISGGKHPDGPGAGFVPLDDETRVMLAEAEARIRPADTTEVPGMAQADMPFAAVTLYPSILRAMAIFTADDATRPMLAGVHMALRPGSCTLSASDSLTAGILRQVTSDADAGYVTEVDCRKPVEFTIPVADIMPLLKLKLEDPLIITTDFKEIWYRRGPWSVRLPPIVGDYPDLGQLFEGTEPEPLSLIGLGQPFGTLVDFAKALKVSTEMHLTLYGSNKVIGVRYVGSTLLEDTFMGAVMPVHTSDDLHENLFGPPEWLTLQLELAVA